jgi:peptidyl-prolyl cis-trans isomerase B (cyclophilin B)
LAVTVAMSAALTSAQSGTSTTSKPAASPQTAKPAPPQTAKPATPQTAKPAGTTPAAKPAAARAVVPKSPDAGPVIVVETERGTFEFETYPKDAPKTVEHIVTLVKRNFYNGQRVHRVVPGFVIQWGDPMTRDMRNKSDPNWGNYGSGKPIGVAEIKRPHKVGAVAMAHAADPAGADSQMYVALSLERTRSLDGKYTVFGQVISGLDVVQRIKQDDLIKRVTIRPETPAAK